MVESSDSVVELNCKLGGVSNLYAGITLFGRPARDVCVVGAMCVKEVAPCIA